MEKPFWSKSRIVWLVFLCSLVCFGCQKPSHTVIPSFYYWKTNYHLTPTEQEAFKDLHCQKLYLRFFDVDWNEATHQVAPVGIVRIEDSLEGMDVVPVVFITQQTLLHLQDSLEAQKLAGNVGHLISGLCRNAALQPSEIQIDCDWTAATKEAYFSFLRMLRQQPFFKNVTLSATIRLHQVKYTSRNGIPPVDRGLLMCYNMGNHRRYGPHNSILDADEAEKYLSRVDGYPLPLDVALPLFRWCILFRKERLVGILRDADPAEVNTMPFLELEKGNLYRCTADTIWHRYSLHRDDRVRVEAPSMEDLRRIAGYTAHHIRNPDLTVALYHLDSLTLSKYQTHELEALYNAYR